MATTDSLSSTLKFERKWKSTGNSAVSLSLIYPAGPLCLSVCWKSTLHSSLLPAWGRRLSICWCSLTYHGIVPPPSPPNLRRSLFTSQFAQKWTRRCVGASCRLKSFHLVLPTLPPLAVFTPLPPDMNRTSISGSAAGKAPTSDIKYDWKERNKLPGQSLWEVIPPMHTPGWPRRLFSSFLTNVALTVFKRTSVWKGRAPPVGGINPILEF